ncbi:unnamed protein product [Cyprideis torosa]|uniref:Uncharacterized protein n=1 Tax=Cyprideis torosa TaxID=163714 RepID=A0A7R8ZVB2_9CRUS|nr:unnamed protein product [Cyprideis torosa]CAG0902733.1 unnamed protein product [Cyprideis torosa]
MSVVRDVDYDSPTDDDLLLCCYAREVAEDEGHRQTNLLSKASDDIKHLLADFLVNGESREIRSGNGAVITAQKNQGYKYSGTAQTAGDIEVEFPEGFCPETCNGEVSFVMEAHPTSIHEPKPDLGAGMEGSSSWGRWFTVFRSQTSEQGCIIFLLTMCLEPIFSQTSSEDPPALHQTMD